MTYEQWVNATKKVIPLGDESADHAAPSTVPSIDAVACDAFGGEGEEEETQETKILENPHPPSFPGPRGLFKKPLGQASLSK